MLIFPLLIINICKTCFIQMCDLKRVRQYLTDEAAILASNALVSSRLDYCNSLFRSLSSFNMSKLKCIQNTLGRIVTNCNRYSRATPILKNSIGCQLNFGVFSKLTLWFISFITVVTQAVSALICLLFVQDMAQDIDVHIKGSWRFRVTFVLLQLLSLSGKS